jgi:dihydroorotate dehydrogenase
MYRALRRALFLVAPERIHTWVFAFLRAVTAMVPVRRLLARWLAPHDPVLASTVFGVRFPGPLGLAAGFDKDGRGLHTWGSIGFGYAEVGTVTAQAQPGNPQPRMFRLPDDRALLNRMGFNNSGAGELALRLSRRTPEVPIGVNIGKTKVTPPEDAVDDYAESARLLGPLAAFLVVNVSSPNTPGLRDLQAVTTTSRTWQSNWAWPASSRRTPPFRVLGWPRQVWRRWAPAVFRGRLSGRGPPKYCADCISGSATNSC